MSVNANRGGRIMPQSKSYQAAWETSLTDCFRKPTLGRWLASVYADFPHIKVSMNFDFSPADEAFRAEVRAFLDANLTAEVRIAAARTTTVFADKDLAMSWQHTLVAKGWAVPQWPVEWGGTNWSVTQKYIFGAECAAAGAPGLIPLGMRMLAPVLFRYGTQEQKEFYLPKILSGEHYWCQGYSEPGSGSDLASLRTRADKSGDDYIVNGTKIWTTHAQFADHIFCLVRTNDQGKPQAGITFLLIDMATPGITVKPIITLAGDHEVNQVFFDSVRVPQANRVGPEDQGWTVAKYLLEFERGGGGVSIALRMELDDLRLIADLERGDVGDRLIDDPEFSARIAALEIRIMSLEFTELSALARIAAGGSPGPGSSLQKNVSVDIGQEIAMAKVEALGCYGVPHMLANEADSCWPAPEHARGVTASYLNGRAASIFGGAREVQKNIIAKTVLGL